MPREATRSCAGSTAKRPSAQTISTATARPSSPRKAGFWRRLATKAALKEMPDLAEVLRVEAERIASVLDRANGAALVERTMSLLRLGLDIVERYARAKRPARGTRL